MQIQKVESNYKSTFLEDAIHFLEENLQNDII